MKKPTALGISRSGGCSESSCISTYTPVPVLPAQHDLPSLARIFHKL
ncbi:MAG: hypothetical protein ACREYE_03905 [Gammaproteobacteria bacterium]